MEHKANKTVLAVLDDLMFIVKIKDAATRAGLQSEFVKTEEEALAKARQHPLLIIVDLNARSVEPIALISKLKADMETRAIDVVSYVSHVQAELKQKAQEAGSDSVLARSAFSTNLPLLFKRHAA